jgi:tetratricopeptide (TPR) repeat protein
MNEEEYIASIRNDFAKDEKTAGKLLDRVEQGLKLFPASAELWCLRGHLIQLSDGEEYSLREAIESYQKAIAIDEGCLDAYEEIGYFYDAIEGDPKRAEPYIRKAVALGGDKRTRKALLDVLGEIRERKIDQQEANGA